MLRCEPAVLGPVASGPTVSRLTETLAVSGGKAVQAVRSAVRSPQPGLFDGRQKRPGRRGQVTVDLDGVLAIAHSDKQDAAATWKKTYGRYPLTAFVNHGQGGAGRARRCSLRPGNAGSNTAADRITTAQPALAQLPKKYRWGGRH